MYSLQLKLFTLSAENSRPAVADKFVTPLQTNSVTPPDIYAFAHLRWLSCFMPYLVFERTAPVTSS